MKHRYKISAVCGLTAILTTAGVHADAMVSGDIELDTDFVSNRDGGDQDDFDQGGRVKVAFAGTKEGPGGGYASAVGQLLVNKDGTTGVDDAYIRIGKNQWGLQFGRFEALEIFSKGTDTIHNVIGNTNFYEGGAARGRTSDTGQIMFDYAPSDTMRFELGTIWGETDGGDDDEDAIAGIRPGFVIDVTGDLRVTAGYEMLTNGETETTGGGLYVRYATDAFALKMNVASGKQETDSVTDWENTSFNVNIESGLFGLGYTNSEDDGGDSASTVYGRYYMPDLMGTGVNGSLGVSLASADSVDEDELGVRYRFNYTF